MNFRMLGVCVASVFGLVKGEGSVVAGLIIAGLSEIPIVNFIAPLYGAAFMVHVFKYFQHRESLA